MSFELGKTYIVDVTEKGIVPLMEFDRNRWFNKDHDDLDLLTDEEKIVIVNDMLDKIKVKIINKSNEPSYLHENEDWSVGLEMALEIIDKYRNEVNE